MARAGWKAGLTIAVCLAGAAWSAGLLYEGFIARRYVGVFTVPFVDAASARRAYEGLPPGASAQARADAAQRLVRADPANASSWAALSFAAYAKGGRMSPEAIRALDRSYELSFFDRRAAVWRVTFALENWRALSPALRDDVLLEGRTAIGDPLIGPKLRQALDHVRDPAGQLAAQIIIASSH